MYNHVTGLLFKHPYSLFRSVKDTGLVDEQTSKMSEEKSCLGNSGQQCC